MKGLLELVIKILLKIRILVQVIKHMNIIIYCLTHHGNWHIIYG